MRARKRFVHGFGVLHAQPNGYNSRPGDSVLGHNVRPPHKVGSKRGGHNHTQRCDTVGFSCFVFSLTARLRSRESSVLRKKQCYSAVVQAYSYAVYTFYGGSLHPQPGGGLEPALILRREHNLV